MFSAWWGQAGKLRLEGKREFSKWGSTSLPQLTLVSGPKEAMFLFWKSCGQVPMTVTSYLLVIFYQGPCPRMNMARVLLCGSHIRGVLETRKLSLVSSGHSKDLQIGFTFSWPTAFFTSCWPVTALCSATLCLTLLS